MMKKKLFLLVFFVPVMFVSLILVICNILPMIWDHFGQETQYHQEVKPMPKVRKMTDTVYIIPPNAVLDVWKIGQAPDILGERFYFIHEVNNQGLHSIFLSWKDALSVAPATCTPVPCRNLVTSDSDFFVVDFTTDGNAQMEIPPQWEVVQPQIYRYFILQGSKTSVLFATQDQYVTIHIVARDRKNVLLKVEYQSISTSIPDTIDALVQADTTISIPFSMENLWVGYYPAVLPEKVIVIYEKDQFHLVK